MRNSRTVRLLFVFRVLLLINAPDKPRLRQNSVGESEPTNLAGGETADDALRSILLLQHGVLFTGVTAPTCQAAFGRVRRCEPRFCCIYIPFSPRPSSSARGLIRDNNIDMTEVHILTHLHYAISMVMGCLLLACLRLPQAESPMTRSREHCFISENASFRSLGKLPTGMCCIRRNRHQSSPRNLEQAMTKRLQN